MSQITQRQIDRKQTTFAKAQVIAASRRIHKSSCSDIWMVENDSVKGKFYCIQSVSIEGETELVCYCAAYTYAMTIPCKHIISLAIKEIA
jgi:hypothetical protein